MKIAVCEDEKLFAERLLSALRSFFESKNEELSAEVYENFQCAESGFEHSPSDLIFMDIDLGGSLDGVELCRHLREKECDTPVIFVTSLENRAVDGYDVSAFGFVVKNRLDEKLPIVMERYWKEYKCIDTVTVTGKSGITIIPVRDILRIEADKRCTLIHTVSGKYTDIRGISKFAEELDSNFTEVFKSLYVNISHIKSINIDTVLLSDNTTVPLSRRQRKNVMLAVMNSMSKGRSL